ncbi:hypothetical protein BLOT_001218 [Blomia tropicalis]|nr:hypothetical protein BLOT_001218 [Blomia tropicalis]
MSDYYTDPSINSYSVDDRIQGNSSEIVRMLVPALGQLIIQWGRRLNYRVNSLFGASVSSL